MPAPMMDPNDPMLQPLQFPVAPLAGRKALVIGIANRDSIAYGVARALRAFGADLAITYLNEKTKAYTEPLASALGVAPEMFLPCDVREPGQLESVFEQVASRWGELGVLVHSIAFAPREDLHGRVTDCSLAGFLTTMEVSVWSLIRMAHLAEALLAKRGGAIFTLSYFGGEKVVPHYGIMGPAKAALETAARYMAAELGPKGIRVNIISPGPVMTRAASGIDRFDELLEKTKHQAPANMLVTPDQVGVATAVLACDHLKIVTGETLYMDGGYNIMGG
jgi:enoyl-[acyl-carrier protein] reductase I